MAINTGIKKWRFFIRIFKHDSFFALDKYFIYIPHFAITEWKGPIFGIY
jgi:hypothetical protein